MGRAELGLADLAKVCRVKERLAGGRSCVRRNLSKAGGRSWAWRAGRNSGARGASQRRKAKAVPSGGLAAKNERPPGQPGALGSRAKLRLGGSSASAPGEGSAGRAAGKGGSAVALGEGRSEGFGSVCGGLSPEGLRAEGGRGVGKTGPEGGAARERRAWGRQCL